jgi:hypothetical protein
MWSASGRCHLAALVGAAQLSSLWMVYSARREIMLTSTAFAAAAEFAQRISCVSENSVSLSRFEQTGSDRPFNLSGIS